VIFDAKIAISCAKRCSGGGFVREIAIIFTTFERNVRQSLILASPGRSGFAWRPATALSQRH
jgi:hypothetical protein